MQQDPQPEAYIVHVWIREIHPMLWRRFLVRSDCTLADLHVVLQIGFDWTDFHLHRFRIRKKDYAVPRLSGLACHDAREMQLADLHFRLNERFLYEYSFRDGWQLQVRIEQRSSIEAGPTRLVWEAAGRGPRRIAADPKAFWSGARPRRGESRNCSRGSGKISTRETSKRSMITSRCCRRKEAHRSFSPLAELLTERTAPELAYLENKFAAMISYGLTAELLAEVLPTGGDINAAGVYRNMQRVGERMEAEMGEEQWQFIEGCQRDWDALPPPGPPITVGLDGGFVHAKGQKSRGEGWFEVIAGKSVREEGAAKCFAYVQTYDPKPKRRLFELLKSQGLQANQQMTFLSDGADDVRMLPLYLSPESEHWLDWFHLTMRLTVMGQLGLANEQTEGLTRNGPGGNPGRSRYRGQTDVGLRLLEGSNRVKIYRV